MGLSILVLLILIFASAISIKLNKNLEKNIFISICLIILVVYLLGLFKFLSIFPYVLAFISLLCLYYIGIHFKKDKNLCKSLLLRPVLIYVLIALIGTYLFSRNYYIKDWDEFSHWGVYVKNMFLDNSLQNTNFTDTSGYPPFVSILQYIVMKLNGVYQEADLLSALLIMSFLAFSSFIKKRNVGKFLQFAFMILVLFLPTIFFKDYLSTTYVDAILGIILGIAVLEILVEKVSLYKLTKISIYAVALLLIKDFAIVCFGIVYFILFLEIVCFRRKDYVELYTSRIKHSFLLKIYVIILFILPVIAFISWRIYLSQFNFIVSNVSKIGFSIPPYYMSVINSFVSLTTQNGISTGSNILFVPTFSYFLISIMIASYAYLHLKKKESGIAKLFILSLVITFVLYCVGLALSYVFIFSEDEAMRLASYGRYILTGILALYIIVLGYINEHVILDNFSNAKPIFIICSVVLLFMDVGGVYNASIGFIQRDNAKNIFASTHYKKYDHVIKTVNKDEKVFYINTASDGFDYYIARYHLTPVHIQSQMWNMKLNNSDSDMMQTKDFIKLLKDYDYVYVDVFNDEFISEYSELFIQEVKNQSFYKVNQNETLSLVE